MAIPPYPADQELKPQKDGYFATFYFQTPLTDDRPKAVLYLRVSSRKQSEEDKHSLPEQWRINWEDAERRGYAVAAVFIDVLSGASRHRKGFQQMMADGKASKYTAIIATMNGQDWNAQRSGTKNALWDISFIDDQHG